MGKMRLKQKSWRLISVLALGTASGCGGTNQFGFELSESSARADNLTAERDDPSTPIVCDPLGSGGVIDAQHGIRTKLRYMPSGTTGSHLSLYQDFGVEHPATLYLNSLDVAPRSFDQGFPSTTGDTLSDGNGNMLIEWFALFGEARLTLPDGAPEGLYQFYSLTDDGFRLEAKIDGSWTDVILNDTLHAPSPDFSTVLIPMKRGEPVSIRLGYFQGPRWEIAMKLGWRKAAALQATPGPGALSNSGADFSVVPSAAFLLPEGVANRCAP